MVSNSVRMTVEWLVPLGQTRPITTALHAVAIDVRSLPGCMGCGVSTDIKNRGTVRYMEEWASEADLRARLLSDTGPQLATLIEDVAWPPRIEFALARGIRGADFFREVRRDANRKRVDDSPERRLKRPARTSLLNRG